MKYFTSMLPKIFCQYNFISDSVRTLWIANNVCWPKKVLCTRQRKNIDKFRSIPISTIDPQQSYSSKLEKSVNSSLAKVNLNWSFYSFIRFLPVSPQFTGGYEFAGRLLINHNPSLPLSPGNWQVASARERGKAEYALQYASSAPVNM